MGCRRHIFSSRLRNQPWCALDKSEPLAFFAGIWTPWKGERESMKNPRAGDHGLFGFLTCDANEIVKPIHPKAMPVILTEPAKIALWLTAEWKDAKQLQRPYSSDAMMLPPLERAEEPTFI
ncbi:SOS response-associated peptidase family protein [Sinorhizobium meliloti]|uniref:SOS response-associated peptidase family protein n=1 Tax=Rhizobium meliloti TaxID=382 RepID=UPI002E0ED7C1|nr:SOS response-associated peptidase family protein [Sinorhizobium meliloti]